jgi:hypothetical protein
MIIHAESAFAPSRDGTKLPSAVSATSKHYTGFLTVPQIDDLVVLLLLDVCCHAPMTLSSGTAQPWWHLKRVGYPCLVAVPAVPLKSPPTPPSPHSPRQARGGEGRSNDEAPRTSAASSNEAVDGVGRRGEGNAALPPRNSSSSVVKATMAAAPTSDDVLYVCVHAAGAAEDALRPAGVAETSPRVRWFQVSLPSPSIAGDLRAVLGAVACTTATDAFHSDGAIEVVCRDIWPLPPVSSPTPPLPDRSSFSVRSHQCECAVNVHTSPTPREVVTSDGTPRGHSVHVDQREEGSNAGEDVVVGRHAQPTLCAVASLLEHLRAWNKGLLEYLFDNSRYVSEVLWASDGAVAEAPAVHNAVKTATATAAVVTSLPTRPSALHLLRLIFRFWQRRLQETSAQAPTPPIGSNESSSGTTRGRPAPLSGECGRSASASLAISTAPTTATMDGVAHPSSPLLCTPTLISRAYFRDTLRTPQKQQPTTTLTPEASWDSGVAAKGAHPLPSPRTLPVTTSTTPPPPLCHLTPVTLIEQLLLSIAFSLVYRQRCVQGDAAASSPLTSFAHAWDAYVVCRALGGSGARRTAAGLCNNSAVHPSNYCDDAKREREPTYDLSGTAIDVWQEWMWVTAEINAATAQSTVEEDKGTDFVGGTDVKPCSSAAGAAASNTTVSTAAADADRHQHIKKNATTTTLSSPAAASQESSPSLFQPCWPSPPHPPRTVKRSTSHVSFSASDVQRASGIVKAPVEKGMNRSSSMTDKRAVAGAASTTLVAQTPPTPSSAVVTAAAAAAAFVSAELLQVVPSLHLALLHPSHVERSTATQKATGGLAASALPSKPLDSSYARSNLPSVTHTALPLRSTSSAARERRVSGVGLPTAGTTQTRSEHASHFPMHPTTEQPTPRPPSQIESWESSSSVEEEELPGEVRIHEGGVDERAGSAVQPHRQEASASAQTALASPPRVGSATHTNFSSSLSSITSEHRLFPDVNEDDSHHQHHQNQHRSGGDGVHVAAAASPLHPCSPPAPLTTRCTVSRSSVGEAFLDVAGTAVCPEVQRRCGVLCSAAAFTTVLSERLSQVLALDTSKLNPAPSSLPTTSHAALPAHDVAAAQRQLMSISCGQLFPSLDTLDTLNLLPYYVHVWCYTYDPLTQNNTKRQRQGGGEGNSSISSSAGGGAGGGAYAHTYLRRYEAGAGAGASHGLEGERGGGAAFTLSAAVASQQLLRSLMLEGARTLWRGVKLTAAAAASSTGGTSATTATTITPPHGANDHNDDDSSSGVTRGAPSSRPSLRPAFPANAGAARVAPLYQRPAPTFFYGGGGGRDATKDPTLYNAVCGLYITEQDVVIRSLPTAEVRQRRERLRQQQRQQRQKARRMQAATQNPGETEGRWNAQQQQRRKPLAHDGSVATMSDGDTAAWPNNNSNNSEEEDTDGEADVEEAELLLLPRVGLLSVTTCAVNRDAGGVFAEKYAHKLFLRQEDQVVALRAQQQQQKRQHRHGLRAAASSTGLADVSYPTLHAFPSFPSRRCEVGYGGYISCDPARDRVAATSIRTHTTLRPFIEEGLQRQLQLRKLSRSSPSMQGDGVLPCCGATLDDGNRPSATSSRTLTGAVKDHCRPGVQRYLASLFRAAAAPAESLHSSADHGVGSPPSVGQLFSKENTNAAAAAAATLADSVHGGSAGSATAAAFAAAASAISASSGSTSQPTLVLKLESKMLPTVWLEFADEATLMYVYRLLETPLRSVATADQRRKGEEGARATAVQLSCLGNRFLSSARRHGLMVPLVLVAANVLPRGSAQSPYMQAFMQNVAAAMTVLKLDHALQSAVLVSETPARPCADERGPTSPQAAPHVGHPAAASPAALCLADTWWLYNPSREFLRQGLPVEQWTLTSVNDRFGFCPTYPSHFIVPATVAEAMELGELDGQHRSSRRVEAVSFFYAPTGGMLVRSAQPAIARLFVNSATPTFDVAALMAGGGRRSGGTETTTTTGGEEEEDSISSSRGDLPQRKTTTQRRPAPLPPPAPTVPVMDAPFLILNAFAAAAGVTPQQLVVMDLRGVTAAYANMMRGGGTMDMLLYPFGGVEYAGLPNIHDIRKAWLRLRQSLLEVPYKLTGEGGARRETQYVLRGGEPPYAAVVAAAECSVVTARSTQFFAQPSLPSSRPPQQQHQPQHHIDPRHQSPLTRDVMNAAGDERSGGGGGRSDRCLLERQQQPGGHGRFAEQQQQDEDADDAERCLDVVEQAPTAARSGLGRHHGSGGAPCTTAAAAAAAERGVAGSTNDDSGDDADEHARSEGDTSPSTFPSLLGKGGCGRAEHHGIAFASSNTTTTTAASMLASSCNAAAAEVMTPAQQEWLGLLAGLLNTSVVAARRVCGVPTDPLYVPAMAHNGATANCFSYVVGHAFTRFWLPVSSAPSAASQHTTTTTTSDDNNNSSGGRSASPPVWWSRKRALYHRAGRAASFFDTSVASFGPSAHRSLAQVVLMNCTDGWDRTAQVSVLTQLLLDPYYRTVEGLCVLLERELVCFGHPLQRRSTTVRGNMNGGWAVDAAESKQYPSCNQGTVTAAPAAKSEVSKEPETGVTAPGSNTENRRRHSTLDSAAPASATGGDDDAAATAGVRADGVDGNEGSDDEDDGDLAAWLDDEATTMMLSEAFSSEDTAATAEEKDAKGAAPIRGADGQHQRQQLWWQLWRRAASAVSGRAVSLKQRVETASGSVAENSACHGGKSSSAFAAAEMDVAAKASLRDASPILAQLLDAIFQLVRLYPACFEYTEQFVLLLLDLHHGGLVSTFAVNSQRQVEEEGVAQGSLSLSQWCALLLSTTATTVAPAAPAAVQPVAGQRPPFTIPATPTSTSGYNAFAGGGGKGASAEASITATTLSSVEASFQRLDSQFLVNGDDGGSVEEKPQHGVSGPPQPLAPWATSNSTQFATCRSGEDNAGACTLPVSQPPPPLPQQQQHTSMPSTSSSLSATAAARAVYFFDYTTRWQPENGDAALPSMPGRAPPPQTQRVSVDTRDEFSRRLLPLSVDALYNSGYLNPKFSLRHNRVTVGPLVDYILPSQLALWHTAHARHTFWSFRASQLQHSVGQVWLHSSLGDGGAATSPHGQRDGVAGATASMAAQHQPPLRYISRERTCHSDRCQASRGRGVEEASGGLCGSEHEGESRGSLVATPPGMLDFHIASDSDAAESN